ncbi:hypothetical protein RQP46_007607 [Phenoliferia psychrophenolica]
MASLPTLPSRLRAPLLFATCAYCSAEIECVDDGAFEVCPGGEAVRRKVECAACGKRFLVSKGADGKAHSSTSLTIHLPSEVLAVIFSYVHQFPTKSTATLFGSSLVSKHWNSCATPILYRDIKIDEWDWRMKNTLLRTLDSSPSLLLLIHSLKTSFPRFEDWGNSLVGTITSEEYVGAARSYLKDLHIVEAEGIEEYNERIPEVWLLAQQCARWKAHEQVHNLGASTWMDDGRNGDTGRRAGACELLALVNRCPSLSTLHLEKFDLGEVDEDHLEARLPLSLDRIVTLVINTTPQKPNPLPHILSRVKNVESLDLGDHLPFHYISLPRLGVLRLRHPLTSDAFPYLESMINWTEMSLRSLRIAVKVIHADRLPQLLSTATKLEELALDMAAGSEDPLNALFTFLASHHTLRRLFTQISLRQALIDSLPPTLVSLAVTRPNFNTGAQFAVLIEELIRILRTSMTSLPTLPTRLRAPLLVVNCAYCSVEVECVDDGAFELSPGGEPVRRKVECVVCGKRFLVSKGASGKAHSSTSLTIHLPSEVLAIIFSYVVQFRRFSVANLFEASLVSKLWHSCATPILYRDLNIDEWDWRMKGTLLRTLDASPSLLPHIRSLRTSFPRFEQWGNSLVESKAEDEYHRALRSYINDLDSEDAREEARYGRVSEVWRGAMQYARGKVFQKVKDAGAATWMDDKRDGDAGRRAGACELLALVSRSPSLFSLHLEKFDLGEVAGDKLEARLPVSLDRIVTLVLNPTPQHPNPLPHILDRVPNIESLDVGDPLPYQWFEFPRLRVLRLRHSLTADAFPYLAGTLEEAAESLRSLRINLKVSLVDHLPALLLTATKLEELCLEMTATNADPLQALLDALASHSSLRRLSTRIVLHSALIESLPPTLVSLAVARPSNDLAVASLIGALMASKRTRTPALAFVRMGFGGSGKKMESSITAARAIGLEIRFERKCFE